MLRSVQLPTMLRRSSHWNPTAAAAADEHEYGMASAGDEPTAAADRYHGNGISLPARITAAKAAAAASTLADASGYRYIAAGQQSSEHQSHGIVVRGDGEESNNEGLPALSLTQTSGNGQQQLRQDVNAQDASAACGSPRRSGTWSDAASPRLAMTPPQDARVVLARGYTTVTSRGSPPPRVLVIHRPGR